MKRLLLILVLLAFCFFTQIVKAEDDAVLMWERQISGVNDIEFSPTNPDIFALARFDEFSEVQNVLIMSVQTGDTIAQLPSVNHIITSVKFSPDGQLLAYGDNKRISIFNLESNEKITEILFKESDFHDIKDMEFTSDGKYLIASCGYIVVINTNDWTVKHKWNEIYHDDSPPPGAIERSSTRDLSIRHDNKVAACVFVPNDIAILYDIEQNQPIDTLFCNENRLKYYNNSNKLLIKNNGHVAYYDFDISNKPTKLSFLSNYFELSNDDKYLFSSLNGYSIYDTETWDKKKYFKTEMKYYGMFDMIDNQYLLSARIGMYDISGLTSVKPDKESTIEISPNPAKDEIRIIGLPLNIKTIEIADLKGNIVGRIEAKHFNDELIHNVSHLPAGAYLLRINKYDDSLSIKFMIER